jgi:hypothetical protein
MLDHFVHHPVCDCRYVRNNFTVIQLIENLEFVDISYIWMTSFWLFEVFNNLAKKKNEMLGQSQQAERKCYSAVLVTGSCWFLA